MDPQWRRHVYGLCLYCRQIFPKGIREVCPLPGVSASSDAMTNCEQAQSPRHSALSALIGSMRDALRAGMYPATRATSSSASAIPR